MVCFQKIGADHVYAGINCQDYASTFKSSLDETVKLVTDGCGSCPHSEVGAILFHQVLGHSKERFTPNNIRYLLEDTVKAIPSYLTEFSDDFILDNWLFTFLMVIERDDFWDVYYAGDGYILAQEHDSQINIVKLDDGEYPQYLGYNLIRDKSRLCAYQDGVELKHDSFLKADFRNVGVASDGLRFVYNLKLEAEKNLFWEYLIEGRQGKLKQLVNKNNLTFRDDLSIAF